MTERQLCRELLPVGILRLGKGLTQRSKLLRIRGSYTGCYTRYYRGLGGFLGFVMWPYRTGTTNCIRNPESGTHSDKCANTLESALF